MGRDPEPAELARLYASYLRHLADDIRVSEGYRVLDGAEALLDRLADAGVVLGVVSGAMEGAARTKMEPARLGRFFVFGAYGSDSPDRVDVVRRAIATAGTLRGTPNDITSAHDAGATAVGVASGHYSADELRDAGADLVLDSLEDPALERLLGL
jgi:phosphoglycolate phosphatase